MIMRDAKFATMMQQQEEGEAPEIDGEKNSGP